MVSTAVPETVSAAVKDITGLRFYGAECMGMQRLQGTARCKAVFNGWICSSTVYLNIKI